MKVWKAVSAVFVGVVLVLAAIPAVADTRDIDVNDLPFGDCGTNGFVGSMAATPGLGNDGAIPEICRVRFNGASYQASTGTWVLFQRRFDIVPTLQDCEALAAATTFTLTINGSAVMAAIQCKQAQPPSPFAGMWVASVEHLSHPFAPGTYVAVLTLDGATSSPSTLTITQGG